MKTSKEFKDNLKHHIITAEMLNACLFSVNKRAKNCRDQRRSYAHSRYRYADSVSERYEQSMNQYYAMKEQLLKPLIPTCIHVEEYPERIRVYSYEKRYKSLYKKAEDNNLIVWENCYWDYEEDMQIYFFDYLDYENSNIKYYLYYELLDRSYHSPIEKQQLKNYPDLRRIKLDENITTFGHEIDDLVSVQFVKSVLKELDATNVDLSDVIAKNIESINNGQYAGEIHHCEYLPSIVTPIQRTTNQPIF